MYTKKEEAILHLLEDNRGRILSSEDIYSAVWNQIAFDCDDVIAVHICNLRRKMKNQVPNQTIRTVYCKGYMLA